MSNFTFQNPSATAESVRIPLAGLPMTLAESRNFHDAINLLGGSLAASRRLTALPPGSDERAQFEVVFGYAMLTMGEARAFWALLSAQLETPALVHLRTMLEHAVRTSKLISDPEAARKIYDSLGASERELAADLDLSPDARKTLEEQFAPIVGTKADRDLLPSMKKMLSTGAVGLFDHGDYRLMSQVTHGTVLALRSVAMITNQVDRDFIFFATLDGEARKSLIRATYLVLAVTNALVYISGADVDDEFMRINDANVELAKNLGNASNATGTPPKTY
jgi:hypothetical protein